MELIQNFANKVNATKWAIVSFCILIFFFGLMGMVMPGVFTKFLKSQINLTPKSDVRPLYEKVPFFIDFRIYMFNCTNPQEVTKGRKPRLVEIGPYFFEEWKEKFDMIDNDEEDTLKYNYKNTFIFRPDLSGPGLTGNEIITMPHPLIATMLMTLNVDKKPMIPMAKEAIDQIFHEPQDMFWTGRVMDVLFRGIPIDCSNTEQFQAKAVCGVFESGEVKAIKKHNDTHFEFSLFQATNGTDLGQFTVFRGKKVSADMGRVAAFNGEPEMDVWDGDECNQYIGTDSTIFPPFLNAEDGIWAYEPSVCRSLGGHYIGKSKYMGLKTAEFAIDIGSPENAKECYCRDPPDECPKRGTFDMFACVGAPMLGSQPHFYGADPELVENFASGIEPNKDKHAIYMHFEMLTGTPVYAAKRLQFNLEMVPIEDVDYLSNIREMYYPLFWVEEGAALDKDFVKQVKMVPNIFKYFKIMKWMGLIVGILGIVLSGFLFMAKQNASEATKSIPNPTEIDVKSIEKSLS